MAVFGWFGKKSQHKSRQAPRACKIAVAVRRKSAICQQKQAGIRRL